MAASRPFRGVPKKAEASLKGQTLTEETASKAAELAFEGAATREHNAFKVPLGKQTIVRALLEAKAMRI